MTDEHEPRKKKHLNMGNGMTFEKQQKVETET